MGVAQSCIRLFESQTWLTGCSIHEFTGKSARWGCFFLIQGIFNPGIDRSPSCRADASALSHQRLVQVPQGRFKRNRKVTCLSSQPSSLGAFLSSRFKELDKSDLCSSVPCLFPDHSFQKWKRLDCFFCRNNLLWFEYIIEQLQWTENVTFRSTASTSLRTWQNADFSDLHPDLLEARMLWAGAISSVINSLRWLGGTSGFDRQYLKVSWELYDPRLSYLQGWSCYIYHVKALASHILNKNMRTVGRAWHTVDTIKMGMLLLSFNWSSITGGLVAKKNVRVSLFKYSSHKICGRVLYKSSYGFGISSMDVRHKT